MANVVQQTSTATTVQTASVTRFYYAGSCPSLTVSSIAAQRQVIVRMIFTMSKLYVNVIANDRGASTLRIQINGANGNEVVAITASTTGKFEDLVNTDVLASGNLISYQLVTGAGGTTFVFNTISHVSSPSVNTFARLVTNISLGLGAGDFYPISGAQSGNTEVGVQCKIFGNGGTFKNLAVFISSNTRDADCTVTLRKNSVNQTMTVTVPTLTTGTFEDLVNTVAVVANDLVNWTTTRPGTTGTCNCIYMAVAFETTDNTFMVNGFGSTTVNAASTVYYTIMGSPSISVTTESEAQSEARITFTLSKLRVFIGTNTVVASSSVTLRKNAANGNQTVSITGLTTGAFEDAVNTDTVVATDLLDSQLITGAGGTSLVVRNITYLATSSSGIGGSASTLLLMGVG